MNFTASTRNGFNQLSSSTNFHKLGNDNIAVKITAKKILRLLLSLEILRNYCVTASL